ncbi:MAG: MFS transporter [Rhodocyclaceae bacterium]|nr:MFS transporter [Rhodocyclaceae bacterium]
MGPVSAERPAAATDTPALLAYGVLGLPLAFAALPVYVHVPALYGGALGIPLAWVGAVLLACRAVDALTDPLIGWFSDRRADRRRLTYAGLPLLLLGVLLLLDPPSGAGPAWLAGALLLATLGYSISTINHTAWAAELGGGRHARASAIAAREGFGLLGVVLAAALPGLLSQDPRAGLAALAAILLPLALAAALVSQRWAPPSRPMAAQAASPLAAWRSAFAQPPVRHLLLVLGVSATAAAIPSATVMFFIADVLQAERWTGAFLALYFLAGAAGLPLWLRLARKVGKAQAWAVAMGLAMGAFAWAATLGPGDVRQYATLCLLSGLALGADLALPPAILSDLVARGRDEARSGTWFGLWNLVTKASLGLAAGLALPLLAWLGFRSGGGAQAGLAALSLVYGLLPIVFKALALVLLLRWRTDFREDAS